MYIDSTKRNTISTTTAIKDQSYARMIKCKCNALNIESNHFTHFGRSIEPIDLELSCLSTEEIKQLGNRDPSIQEVVYASKLPLRAMKVAAGYSKNEPYWNPRTTYVVPEDLRTQMFPFVERCVGEVDAAVALDKESRVTAMAFLRMLDNLRSVILQDVAVLIKLGRKHPLFEERVFKCDRFKRFCEEINNHIDTIESPMPLSVIGLVPPLKESLTLSNTTVRVQGDRTLKAVEEIRGIVNPIHNYLETASSLLRSGMEAVVKELNSPHSATLPPSINITEQNQFTAESIQYRQSEIFPIKFTSISEMYGIWQSRIHTLEKSKGWRFGWSSAEEKRFSRFKIIVKAVDRRATRLQIPIQTILQELDATFMEHKMSMEKMIKTMKFDGDA